MATYRRGGILAGLFLASLAAGCNVLTLPFFIFGPEPKIPAVYKSLADEKKDRELKVAVLTYSGLETRPELLSSDRELSRLVGEQLNKWFEYNREKVSVLGARRVEEYKSEHPDWHARDLERIGRDLGVDYVIYLEVNRLTLYEKGSVNTLYRGRTDISVSLTDVNDPDRSPGVREFSCTFPGDGKAGVPVDDSNPQQFRQAFLGYVAKRLAWYFTSHPTRVEYASEG